MCALHDLFVVVFFSECMYDMFETTTIELFKPYGFSSPNEFDAAEEMDKCRNSGAFESFFDTVHYAISILT